MDPTAFVTLANSIIQLIIKISEGQPPEVRKQLWEWYVKDIAWWREFLKIDEKKEGIVKK